MARQAPRTSGRRPSAPARGGTRSRQTGTTRPALETRLRILDGASAGTEYAIAGSLVRIGRGDDNDIALPDSNCSRNHAELVRDGSGRYLVRDVGSRNGIQVNRKKVPQAVLSSGDRVTIGSTTVEFLTGGDAGGSAGAGGGSSATRWLVVAVAAGIIGFALVSFGGGSGKNTQQTGSGGPIVIGLTPDVAPGAATPAPTGEAGVSIASLFATAQTAPVGNQKGSEVSRNQTTKAPVGAVTPVNLSIPTGGSNEKIIAAIMAEGERAYGSGKLVDARAFFDRAVKLDPNCERCVNRYDFLDRQITKEITDAMAVGVTYLDNQRWDQAIMAFEKVKFLDPNPTSVNNANATAYIDDAKQKKAAGGR